ncbi:tetratricopeptide repeat protein [Lacinutrix sp. Bg11-31]|uniref:tetratricopeptide repeat protein n=1 Tax=Lacinutrix sp. Bg11-31 TaxID=2057808 RepID=UPI000C30D6D8|nr:tetratricopeptide repeat protein [Lacinutrix sp. Bg11-31]AUC83357.1 hypothetical protein CW733_14940 [Lacinutrix sp. Bg11-31]
MKLYEKIILIIFTVSFSLLLIDFTGNRALFSLSTWLLSASYFIGGYWFFKLEENKKEISIISGIALAISLFNLPFLIRINKEEYYDFLPIANGLLFLFLVGYIFFNKDSNSGSKKIKLILLRSFTLLIISTFFTYTSINFKPYRTILYALNNGYNYLQKNILMFDYCEKSKNAININKCDEAIQYAIEANNAGKVWIGISEEEISNHSELWKISGTYSGLYDAYRCNAKNHFKNHEYKQALDYYIKADNALNNYKKKSEYWELEKSYSKNIIAICYKELQNYELADSLFVEAIDNYKSIKDTIDGDAAVFYSNYAESLAEQNAYKYSNLLYKSAIVILKRDTINTDNKKKIINNYRDLIKNHFRTDSLEQAKLYIDKTYNLVDNSTSDLCNINYYKGIYYYKLSRFNKAEEIFSECLACYKEFVEPSNQNIAGSYLMLSRVKTVLGQYDKARETLKKGIKITTENFGKNSEKFANYLKTEAQLDNIIGEYNNSEKKFHQVIEIYNNTLGENNWKLPEVLSNLAQLEITLGKYKLAKIHSDASIKKANEYINFTIPSSTTLLNNAAYVDYYVSNYNRSDSLYKKTVQINKEFGLVSTLPYAVALNGLGLISTSKKEYKKADSLFDKTLKLHKEIFTKNHPFTAVIYYNYAALKIEQKDFVQAKEMLSKAININHNFFNSKHDVFGDIYIAFGDVFIKEKELDTGKDYYLKALDIFVEKFDENHIKVQIAKEKLKKIR